MVLGDEKDMTTHPQLSVARLSATLGLACAPPPPSDLYAETKPLGKRGGGTCWAHATLIVPLEQASF